MVLSAFLSLVNYFSIDILHGESGVARCTGTVNTASGAERSESPHNHELRYLKTLKSTEAVSQEST
ncbi:hypothetical protein WALSEDRAFT_59262 [Wallemia mellicola CBS 633.66]|uniref:Uncharacterized protein n=1 Tax=Wallemia mellicola (strain ATCC MYA-4683 / CBS 633.66) TaxID=671144 RepID=I4YHW5_WALMC|nr:hypothetical protein WALSEDRAFT_59262 [Wallemia mellicola CBS 633.66]EIM23557.1 hypothetical protein WALSEDRAFT_59262 [Wallemia mellicola CBS 633.66]|eukprot:XP_006956233.1 hypothetical protein WALSEDRAFT_59262 [Wallemia mellicola CBS 633.66]